MTDKKALEVLKSWLQLAYQNADGTDECCAELYEALQTVFALINRQQAENKELAEAIHNLTIEKDALFDKAEELKTEIERLKGSVIVNNIMESQKIKREAKTEAYKEFADRLMNALCKLFEYNNGIPISTSYQITLEELVRILKEMVEKNK